MQFRCDVERAADMLPEGVEIVECDATDGMAVNEACKDSSVIYNCTYVGDQMKEVAGNLLNGAREAGAKLVNPGNALVDEQRVEFAPAPSPKPAAAATAPVAAASAAPVAASSTR